jgi:hypothetical protein
MRRDFNIVPAIRLNYAIGLAIILMLAQSLTGQTGATYYVSKHGKDSNPGTYDSPWQTI